MDDTNWAMTGACAFGSTAFIIGFAAAILPEFSTIAIVLALLAVCCCLEDLREEKDG